MRQPNVLQSPGDTIVPISPAREKFFGCSGRMLLPSRATVEAALARIPKGNLITTDLLRSKLAHQFGVEVTCPATMQTALRAIARDATGIPFWRVVKRNGELMSIFPGGAANHAKLLRREGFKIDAKGKVPEVHEFAQSLMSFVI